MLRNTRQGVLISGPLIVSGPRVSSAIDIRRTPWRLVNHELLGTSSSVLMFCASVSSVEPRSAMMCPNRSNISLSSMSAGLSGTSPVSLSMRSGSSG